MSDPTQTTNAPAPGSPEYEAAAAARFDDANNVNRDLPPAQKAERPEHIPEKFWDADKGEARFEDLAKAYGELERRFSGGEKTPETKPTFDAASSEGQKALEQVGLDYSKYEAEFASTGKLSEAAYAEMAAKNIPRSVVDAHIQAQVRLAEYEANSIRASVFEVTGGEEKFSAMTKWAAQNLPQAEIAAFNSAVESNNVGSVKLAVQGLFAKYSATQGQDPTLINGTGGRVAGDVFRSTAELTAAMRDPRYAKDPAYRSDVEAKLSRSNIM